MSFRALQREWYAKAAASGFVDLEGSSGDGPLSDRGNLHPVAETAEEHQRLASRLEEGESFTSWAESVLYAGGFGSKEERECWRLHAAGHSERTIATTLTLTRYQVYTYLDVTRNRVGKVGRQKRWVDQKRQRTLEIRRLVTRCDPQVLAKLVAVMMRQQGLNSR